MKDKIQIGNFRWNLDGEVPETKQETKSRVTVTDEERKAFNEKYEPVIGAVKDILDYTILTSNKKEYFLWLETLMGILGYLKMNHRAIKQVAKEGGN